MTTILTYTGIAWLVLSVPATVLLLGLCHAAARADRVSDQILGRDPHSEDDQLEWLLVKKEDAA